MKKTAILLAVTLMTAGTAGINAHAENLDKDYIISEIWADIWHGKPDNGQTFPEASYKYHLLTEWVEENYGDDNYNWSDVGELRYDYRDYYQDLIEDYDFNDDENGNWTIDTADNHYSFYLLNGTWQMIDQNGNTVDTFPPHDTLAKTEISSQAEQADGDNSDNIKLSGQEKMPTESDVQVSETVQNGSQSTSEESTNPLLYGVIGSALIAVIIIGIYVTRNRK